jgi:hypothetical protein
VAYILLLYIELIEGLEATNNKIIDPVCGMEVESNGT